MDLGKLDRISVCPVATPWLEGVKLTAFISCALERSLPSLPYDDKSIGVALITDGLGVTKALVN